ncbi:MAG TPA: TetR/AcrR family transcriptional regulator, partial [Mycobacterium sp.]|nr:TetR/AcrR family transcriptional regulator [Mycobacterium sp.]
ELASLYRAARRRADEIRTEIFSSWEPGTLRLDVVSAVDVYAALCNIDVYTTLTVERGWSPDGVESWWTEVLRRELLA